MKIINNNLKKILVKEVKFIFILFSLVAIPFLKFIKIENYIQLIFSDIIILITFYFFILIFILIISYYLSKITKTFTTKKNFKHIAIFFAFFFIELFYFSNLNEFILILNPNKYYIYYYSFIILLVLFFLSLVLIFKFKKNIYLFCQVFIILTVVNLLLENFNLLARETNENELHFKNFTLPEKKLNENVYLIIVDEMASFELFIEEYPDDKEIIEQFKLTTQKNGSIYLENTFSNYNLTYLVFTSFFYLGSFIDDNATYFLRNKFFPNNLINNLTDLPLIKYLNNYKHNFINIGNSEMSLEVIDLKTKSIKYNYKLILLKFFEPTFLDEIYRFTIKKNIFGSQNDIYKLNDGIGEFLKKTKNYNFNEKNFYLVHHFSPHSPYLFDENCKKNLSSDSYEYKVEKVGKINAKDFDKSLYNKAYKCVLKKISLLLKELNEIDPNGIVIIQGDHSYWSNHDSLKRYSIFNLLKINKNCKDKIFNNINNINTVRLALFCAANQEPEFVEQKIYRGFYEDSKNYGKVLEIKN